MSNRTRILLSIAIASLAAYLYLGISVRELFPRGNGIEIVQQFAAAALGPEANTQNILMALLVTVKYAVAAITLAFACGVAGKCPLLVTERELVVAFRNPLRKPTFSST